MNVLLLALAAALSMVAADAAPLQAAQTPAGRAQAGTPVSPDARAEAYAQFLLAQRLADTDDVDGAVAAYRRAMTLDPTAAAIPAELADLYMRQSRAAEAIAAAEQALKIDPAERDAHRVLGTIYGSMASETQRGSQAQQRENLTRAITHLEQAAARREDGGQVDANVRAMLARLYVLNGDNDKAIPVLSELVKQEPGWQDGALLLVEAYSAAGRGEEAIAWLEAASPDNPQLYPTLADLYARNRRWNDAASAYERALQVSRSFDLRVRYASTLLSAGGRDQAARARDVLREAMATRKPDERGLALLTLAERRAGDYDAAERTARRLVELNPRGPRGYVSLAETLAERRRYADVVRELEPAVAQLRSGGASAAQSLAQVLPHLAFAYQQLRQFPQAIKAFEEARTLSPRDVSLTAYLVQAHIGARNFDAAVQLARAARKERPNDLRLAGLESEALVEAGRRDEGLAVLEAVVRQQADNPEAHVMLAQAYSEVDRRAQAIKTLQDAKARFPRDTTVAFQLGAVFEQDEKYPDAEAAFREVLAIDPEHAPTLNYLGYMLADRGERLTESVELIKRALALDPENGSYLDSLGWAYYREGRFDLAEEYLRRAADQLATNSVVQDHYGDVLIRLGRADEAIAAWTRALEGDGDSIERDEVERKIRSARQKSSGR